MMTKQLDLLNDFVLGVLVKDTYIPSTNHASLADVPAASRVAFSGTLEGRSVHGGVFGADPTLAESVYGDQIVAVVLCKYTPGDDLNSPLIAFLDQSPDLPKTPNGGDLIFHWDQTTYKIFAI